MKIVSEDTGVEVRSAESRAVFSSHVVTNSDMWIGFPESFEEKLEIPVVEAAVFW
jgi:hypothetical protein